MFKLNEKIEIDRRNLKCDFIKVSLAEAFTINTPKSQILILYLENLVLLVCQTVTLFEILKLSKKLIFPFPDMPTVMI